MNTPAKIIQICPTTEGSVPHALDEDGVIWGWGEYEGERRWIPMPGFTTAAAVDRAVSVIQAARPEEGRRALTELGVPEPVIEALSLMPIPAPEAGF